MRVLKGLWLAIIGFCLVAFVGCVKRADPVAEPIVGDSMADAPGSMNDGEFEQLSATLEPIYFGFDEANLPSQAQAALDAAVPMLRSGGARVLVEGHCDERGSVEYNLALGQRRAEAVKNYLVQMGVPSSAVETISYGESNPAVEGHSEAAWAQNRRAEFRVSR